MSELPEFNRMILSSAPAVIIMKPPSMAYLNKIVGQVIECVLTINIIFKNYLNPPFNGAV